MSDLEKLDLFLTSEDFQKLSEPEKRKAINMFIDILKQTFNNVIESSNLDCYTYNILKHHVNLHVGFLLDKNDEEYEKNVFENLTKKELVNSIINFNFLSDKTKLKLVEVINND